MARKLTKLSEIRESYKKQSPEEKKLLSSYVKLKNYKFSSDELKKLKKDKEKIIKRVDAQNVNMGAKKNFKRLLNMKIKAPTKTKFKV